MSDKTEFIGVRCSFCGLKFNKTIHRYKESIKNGWNFYCSKNCGDLARSKKIDTKCHNCGKDIVIENNRHQKSKNVFCSKSCSATYNNSNRKISNKTRDKIRQSLNKYHKKRGSSKNKISCACCGKLFKATRDRTRCCSEKCGKIYQFGSQPYTKEDVINGILNKYNETGRTPQRRDCLSRVVSAASRLFGTWNKAVKECGLKPNSSKYQKIRLKCLDGHMGDSISEKIVDDWFFNNGMAHERNKKYPNSNMNCDFYFTNLDLWVEYFGLLGECKEYDEIVSLKREIVKRNGLRFVELSCVDLYPDIKLNEIFKKFV